MDLLKDENKSNNDRNLSKESDINDDKKEEENEFFEDLSSDEKIFEEEPLEKKEEKEKESENEKNNLLLEKKKKRELTEEEKKEEEEKRIQNYIHIYCQRNNEIIQLLKNIDNSEITKKNIKRLMLLLSQDLRDTKKITNINNLISHKKEIFFNKLYDLTYKEYQLFWLKITQYKYKYGKAQDINSGNISQANSLYNQIIQKKKDKEKDNNNKKEKTIREIIEDRNKREIEIEELDKIFSEEISSDEDNLDSDGDESSLNDDESIKKSEKEKEDKEKIEQEKEKENERELKEKEEEEMMKKFEVKEDEISIFNI